MSDSATRLDLDAVPGEAPLTEEQEAGVREAIALYEAAMPYYLAAQAHYQPTTTTISSSSIDPDLP